MNNMMLEVCFKLIRDGGGWSVGVDEAGPVRGWWLVGLDPWRFLG